MKKGLSLVELLTAMAILSFVGILVASVYFTHFKIFSYQSSSIDAATQNKLALDEIINQVRESQGVAVSCCSPVETTSASVLVLQLWPLDATSAPFDNGTNYDYIIYKRDTTDNTKFIKKIVPSAGSTRSASNKIIAINISNLSFNYDAAAPSTAVVTVTIDTAVKSTFGKTYTVSQSEKAMLRNK